MKKPIFTGASVAIVTPFDRDGSVNFTEFGKMIDFQIENGTDSITIVGTTGEAPALSDKEHRAVISYGVEHVAGRVPTVCGTGSNHTDYALELTKFAKECGATAGLSVTPYYNKTTQRGLIAHFTQIADCCDLPTILYNVPSRTGISFTPATYLELSKHPNINGVKEASGNFSLAAETLHLCGDNLNMWSGNDDQIVPLMSLGAKGVISVLSNIAPQATHDMTAACLNGDFKTGAKLQLDMMPLINSLFTEVNPIPVKAAVAHLGFETGKLRMPLVELSKEHDDELVRQMKAFNLI